MRRTPWEETDASVTGAIVDGVPVAATLPGASGLFQAHKRRTRRMFRPGEQTTLKLPGVPPIPHDLRLIALREISADPDSGPRLTNDVLRLLTLAWVVDRPFVLHELQGAAWLAYHRDGQRRPAVKSDVPRFWLTAAALRMPLFDPRGTGRWVDMATIEVPSIRPVDRVIIGPPSWGRPLTGKWTLTAEGSASSIARPGGKQGMAGRIITGIEYRLAAEWDGTKDPRPVYLRPAERRRKASAGPLLEIGWRYVMRLAGEWWDETDPKADYAALQRYRRAVALLERRRYFVPDESVHKEAPAGDSVEILCRVRGCRGRPSGLQVRASARFVEAASLAQLLNGKGFETRLLTDWAGI